MEDNNQELEIRKGFKKFILAVIFIILIFTCIYLVWNNKANHNAQTNTEVSRFPVTITDRENYQSSLMGEKYVLMKGSYIYYYTNNGEMSASRQITYANPLLQTTESYALVYENNGYNFRLENEDEILFRARTEKQIYYARLAKNGNVAVVSQSDRCSCLLQVFKENGTLIYERQCMNLLIDLDFYEDGEGCAAAYYDVVDGKACTTLFSIDFLQEETLWKSTEPIDLLTIKIETTADRHIILIGDSKVAYFDEDGTLIYESNYTGELINYDVSDSRVCMLLKNDLKKNESLLLFDGYHKSTNSTEVDNLSLDVTILGEQVVLLTQYNAIDYNFLGEEKNCLDLEGSYQTIFSAEPYLYLQGYDRIERLELP